MQDPSQQTSPAATARYQSFWKLVLMVLNICMAPFYFGYNIAYFGTFDYDTIKDIFGVTMPKNLANGLLQGLVPIGAGIGALTSFLFLKYFSRRNSLLIVGGVALGCGIMLLFPYQGVLIAGRFVQGICVGLYSALAPLLIKEFAPTEISGTMGALNQFFIAFGVFFACFLQFVLLKINKEIDHWRIMFGFTLLTTALQVLLLLFVYTYETPKYLLEQGREEDCRRVLQYIYKEQYVNEVLAEKKRDLGHEDAPSEPDAAPTRTSESVLTDKQPLMPKKSQRVNMLRLIIAIHLAVLQQFVGINVVVGYGTDIAKSIFPDLANVIPVFLNLEQVLTALTSSYLLVRVGRKAILQTGTVVGVVSLVLVAAGFLLKKSHDSLGNTLIMVGLIIFMANFGMSLGPVVWLYIPEILEPRYIPISTLGNWASAALIMFLYPVLTEAFHTSVPLFFFFAAWCAVSFFVGQKFLIETKGKQEKDIFTEYDRLLPSRSRSPLEEATDDD